MNRRLTPVPADVEYHRVLAGDKRRIGRGISAIALVVVGLLAFTYFSTVAAAAIDAAMGAERDSGYSPLMHAAGIASVALLIPWSMLVQRWLYRVRGASLHSVFSRFRFDLFGRAVLFVSPLFLVVVVLQFLTPLPQSAWSYTDVLWVLAGTILLVPLQAAGEEYGFRGLIFRVAGGWTRGARAGLVVGVLASSIAFAFVHLSADAWLNVWYLAFAVSTAIITWRTGGIEVAVVMHAVFNVLNFVFDAALRVDLDTALAERAGTAATILPGVAVMLGTATIVWVRTRRSGPARTRRIETPPPAGGDAPGTVSGTGRTARSLS